MDDSMKGSEVIRGLRMERKLSLRALAGQLDINYVYLSRLERGLETPSEGLIKKIASTLGYSGNLDQLIAEFGKVPESVRKFVLDDPESVVALPAFFKSRRKRRTE